MLLSRRVTHTLLVATGTLVLCVLTVIYGVRHHGRDAMVTAPDLLLSGLHWLRLLGLHAKTMLRIQLIMYALLDCAM